MAAHVNLRSTSTWGGELITPTKFITMTLYENRHQKVHNTVEYRLYLLIDALLYWNNFFSWNPFFIGRFVVVRQHFVRIMGCRRDERSLRHTQTSRVRTVVFSGNLHW